MDNDDSTLTVLPHGTSHEDDIALIGQAMTRMRLMIGRRFIGKLAIERHGAGMELSHLDVLGVVRRLQDSGEATIGAIAQQMRIDPSRSSRIVADLVKRGALKRQVSQEDARRSIVVLTDMGRRLLSQVKEVKLEAVSEVLADWPPEDSAVFARLFDKFIEGLERRYQHFETESDPIGHGSER